MDTQLKIFALEYVKLHDNLLKEEKLAIGEFIIEASDDQVKFMLATGEVKDELTEEDKSFLEASGEWGQAYDVGHWAGKEVGHVQGVAAAALVAAAVVAGNAIYKRFLSKAARACKEKGGMAKTDCMMKYKKQAQAAKVKTLQSGLSKCTKSKDPAKCKLKLQAQIHKAKAKMGAL